MAYGQISHTVLTDGGRHPTLRSRIGKDAGVSSGSVQAVLRVPVSGPGAARPRVVLCDDEAAIRTLYRRALRSYDVDLVDAADGERCLELVALLEPALVVLDLTLPGRGGFDLLPTICELSPATRVVVVSGLVTVSVVHEALALGATACVGKVQFVPQLRAMVRDLVR